METTVADGKRYNINDYNLDDIIAVGYRVNFKKAMMFRLPPNMSFGFQNNICPTTMVSLHSGWGERKNHSFLKKNMVE